MFLALSRYYNSYYSCICHFPKVTDASVVCFFADFVVHSSVAYCVLQSQQKRNVPARSEFIEKKVLKRKKSISDLLVMTLPEHVVASLLTSSSSSMNARMTSLDPSLSPESMQSFSFSSSLLLSFPPLSSSSLSLLSLSDKDSFSALSQFLSFVADQSLQDSFGEASVWLDASLV